MGSTSEWQMRARPLLLDMVDGDGLLDTNVNRPETCLLVLIVVVSTHQWAIENSPLKNQNGDMGSMSGICSVHYKLYELKRERQDHWQIELEINYRAAKQGTKDVLNQIDHPPKR